LRRKLQADTWFYAKRCLLALMEHLSKNMLTLEDKVSQEIISFLRAAETHGKGITTIIGLDPQGRNTSNKNTVAVQAAALKRMMLRLAS
jgi:tetratricopeptide repeat protein 30